MERERAEEDAAAAKPKGVEMGIEAIGIAPPLVANRVTFRIIIKKILTCLKTSKHDSCTFSLAHQWLSSFKPFWLT